MEKQSKTSNLTRRTEWGKWNEKKYDQASKVRKGKRGNNEEVSHTLNRKCVGRNKNFIYWLYQQILMD